MVWVGLAIALASSLVACIGQLKYSRNVKPWSRGFLGRNRLVLISSSLAIAGFIVAVFGVLENQQAAENERQRLRTENQRLQSLMLQGKTVTPVVELAFQTQAGEAESRYVREYTAWESGLRPGQLPKPIGFVPRAVRKALFPRAAPDRIFRFIGMITIRTARPEWAVAVRIRDDGSILPLGSSVQPENAMVRLLNHSGVVMEVTLAKELDALQLFQSVVRHYEHNRAPIVMRIYTPQPHQVVSQALRESNGAVGRVTVFLDDSRQIGVTALLRTGSTTIGDGETTVEWIFAEAPHLEVTLPGGLY